MALINEVKQALEEAVQRGVKVCLLLDSVGSKAFLEKRLFVKKCERKALRLPKRYM